MTVLDEREVRPALERQRSRLFAAQTAVKVAAGRLWQAIIPQEPPGSVEELRAAGDAWVTATSSVTESSAVTVADDAIALTRFTAESIGMQWYTDVTGRETLIPSSRELASLLQPLAAEPTGEAWREAVAQVGRRAEHVTGRYVIRAANRAANIAARESRLFHGWRRVTTGNPCGMCLADSSRGVHQMSEKLLFHLSCRCSRLFLPDGVDDVDWLPDGRDLWDRMTEEEQNALFTGRGGAEKAALVRSGDVPLDALIRTDVYGRSGEQSLHMMQRIARARERAGLPRA